MCKQECVDEHVTAADFLQKDAISSVIEELSISKWGLSSTTDKKAQDIVHDDTITPIYHRYCLSKECPSNHRLEKSIFILS